MNILYSGVEASEKILLCAGVTLNGVSVVLDESILRVFFKPVSGDKNLRNLSLRMRGSKMKQIIEQTGINEFLSVLLGHLQSGLSEEKILDEIRYRLKNVAV